MKVILTKDVPNIGRKNEVKEVREGFGRNFLLPRKLAVLATDGAMREREKEEGKRAENKKEEDKKNREMAEQLKLVELRFKVKVGEKGKAFGSISRKDIQEALRGKGISVEKDQIETEDSIKTTGEHRIAIKLSPDITGELKIVVERE